MSSWIDAEVNVPQKISATTNKRLLQYSSTLHSLLLWEKLLYQSKDDIRSNNFDNELPFSFLYVLASGF